MEFLNPAALYGLLALPLLLIPYLMRRRPRRMIFSSLMLFSAERRMDGARPWGRLRLPPIFFLQLLLLTLLILALANPVFSVRPSKVAIVLDNSASMQALEDGRPRFLLAREQAQRLLANLDAAAKVDLYATVPRLEKIRATSLSADQAATVIESMEPYDLGDQALDYNVLSQMAREQNYDRVYLVTDHPARSQGGAVRVLTVGKPQGNLALTAFSVRRSSLANARLQGVVDAANFSARDEKVRVTLRAGATVLSSRDIVIAAGKSAAAVFDGILAHPYYEAELEARDALPLDNRRFAVAPPAAELRILAVSPRPQAVASLRAIPGVSLDIVSPADYPSTQRAAYGLEIFHFSAPQNLPRAPTLLALPPDENPLAGLGTPVARPLISGWREAHPLTRYVNFALFRPSYARALKPRSAGDRIIEGPDGPLAFVSEEHGARRLVLGFDPFPYLGRENLPMSIFTLNLLDWFFESAAGRSRATGETLVFDAARQGDHVLTPKGEKVLLKADSGAFFATYYQGIYELSLGDAKELFAVNFQAPAESDLRSPAPIEIGAGAGAGAAADAPGWFSYWHYLLAAALVLSFIEWFIPLRPGPLAARAIIRELTGR